MTKNFLLGTNHRSVVDIYIFYLAIILIFISPANIKLAMRPQNSMIIQLGVIKRPPPPIPAGPCRLLPEIRVGAAAPHPPHSTISTDPLLITMSMV